MRLRARATRDEDSAADRDGAEAHETGWRKTGHRHQEPCEQVARSHIVELTCSHSRRFSWLCLPRARRHGPPPGSTRSSFPGRPAFGTTRSRRRSPESVQLAQANNFVVDVTENPSAFNDANLARFQVVIFALTTGDVLDAAQQGALERFIRSGRGFVGIHSASDTEYDWAWYGGLVGAYFRTHGPIEPGTVLMSDATHPHHVGAAGSLGAHRRVVPIPRRASGERAHSGDARRPRAARDHLVPAIRQRPIVLYRGGAHRGVVRRGSFPESPAQGNRIRRRRVDGELRLSRWPATARRRSARRSAAPSIPSAAGRS